MIDLHCHVLPGVDDGPRGLEDALAMCRLAAEDGCSVLVATPHLRHPSWPELEAEGLRESYETLREAVDDLVEIRLGAEIRVDRGLLEELGSRSPSFLSLAGGRYLLLELDRWGAGPEPEELVHEVQVAGRAPILAHPEHIPYLADDIDRLEDLVREGALLQVTAMSVTGEFGRDAHRAVWRMLEREIVHLVASDAHSPAWRPPGLADARRLLASRLGEDVGRRLTEEYPARVLNDRPILRDLPQAREEVEST